MRKRTAQRTRKATPPERAKTLNEAANNAQGANKRELERNREVMTYNAQKVFDNAVAKKWKVMYYKHYSKADLTSAQAQNLSIAAAVLLGFAKLYHTEVHKHKGHLMREFAKIVVEQEVKYLPKNWRVLQSKVMELAKGESVFDTVTLPRKGNQNRIKLKSM